MWPDLADPSHAALQPKAACKQLATTRLWNLNKVVDHGERRTIITEAYGTDDSDLLHGTYFPAFKNRNGEWSYHKDAAGCSVTLDWAQQVFCDEIQLTRDGSVTESIHPIPSAIRDKCREDNFINEGVKRA